MCLLISQRARCHLHTVTVVAGVNFYLFTRFNHQRNIVDRDAIDLHLAHTLNVSIQDAVLVIQANHRCIFFSTEANAQFAVFTSWLHWTISWIKFCFLLVRDTPREGTKFN